MKMMYGMVADLLRRRVTDIFLPVLLESSRSTPPQVRLALPQVTGLYALKGVFPLRSTARGSEPNSTERAEISVVRTLRAGLGLPRGEVRRAFDAAERASETARLSARRARRSCPDARAGARASSSFPPLQQPRRWAEHGRARGA